MAKPTPPAPLPADLLAHLEAEWPNRILLERTYAMPAAGADRHLLDQITGGLLRQLLEIAIEKNLAVFKIGKPRWYRRAAEHADRAVLADANPIPADRRDIPWTLAAPVVLTDTLICRLSAEAVPALLEEPSAEEKDE